ncbi:MAG TPA: hypothetical protein VF625_15130, partial [Longimicrobium sp.]
MSTFRLPRTSGSSVTLGELVNARWLSLSATGILAFWIAVYVWLLLQRSPGGLTLALVERAAIMGGSAFVATLVVCIGGTLVGWRAEHSTRSCAATCVRAAPALVLLACVPSGLLHLVRGAMGGESRPLELSLGTTFPHHACLAMMFVAMGWGLRRVARSHDFTLMLAQLRGDLSAKRFEATKAGLGADPLIEWMESIGVQISADPLRADDSLVRFATLLRLSLERSHSDSVSFGAEADF